jgi:DNA-binding response OmpR family regulator
MSVSSLVSPHPHSSVATERGTVLFVEDEDYIAELVAVILGRAGMRAIRARDGAEALRWAAENHSEISVALVDLCLPDISGDELCRKLRALRPGLPVLLTSGREMENFLPDLEAGGPTGAIAKPYRPAELLKQVRSMLPRAA